MATRTMIDNARIVQILVDALTTAEVECSTRRTADFMSEVQGNFCNSYMEETGGTELQAVKTWESASVQKALANAGLLCA